MTRAEAYGVLVAVARGTYRYDEDGGRVCLVCHTERNDTSTGHASTCPVEPALRRAEELIEAADGDFVEQQACGLALEHGRALHRLDDLQMLRVVLDSVLEVAGESKLLLTVAERLGLLPEKQHVFREYSYGVREVDGREIVTITGESFCGRPLNYGGNWEACTEEQFTSSNRAAYSADEYCPGCLNAMGFKLVPYVVSAPGMYPEIRVSRAVRESFDPFPQVLGVFGAVHVLYEGVALCGAGMQQIAGWVRVEDFGQATCDACRARISVTTATGTTTG